MTGSLFEGTKVRVTIPAFVKLFGENNEWVVIGMGERATDGRFMYNCVPCGGKTVYHFFKTDLEIIEQ